MPLRFGITALEFDDVVEKVVIDGVPDFSRLDVVEIIRESVSDDFSVLELSLDVKHIIPGSLTPETINRLISLKEELGHSYTIHLPFWSVELATFNEHVRMGGVETTIDTIELTKPLEPEAYVLHTTGEMAAYFSGLNYNDDIVRLISTLLAGLAATSVEDIISRTEINPRKLAIENVTFPFDIMRDVIDDLDSSICFDTAHLLSRMSGSESVMDFYNAHKDRITEIHLQDATYIEYEDTIAREDHLALGHGILGDAVLREFLLELVKDKFAGPIIFELTKDEAYQSLDLIRKLVPEAMN
ncbi:MAG: cobamide remodeling phosphodiesterase CbiR [Candidatus Thorarchaeota archaeon]|jgi:sugar phosphate isomerase/epimerase